MGSERMIMTDELEWMRKEVVIALNSPEWCIEYNDEA
jgi:hypothetical protein